MKQIVWLILCSLTFLIVIVINYTASTNLIGPMSVGDISDKYLTAITPASYAFSIWGVIYFLLALFLCYLWYGVIVKRNHDLIDASSFYFTLSNIANVLWIIVWVNDLIVLSLISILLLLIFLFKLVRKITNLRHEISFGYILLVRLPTSLYLGWITLATLLNTNVFLQSISYKNIDSWSSLIVGAILLIIAIVFYHYLICKEKMYETAIAGIWGLIAIIVGGNGNALITIVAILDSIILLFNALYCSHVFSKNRRYS